MVDWSEHLGLVVGVGCDPFILYCTGSCRLLGLGGPSCTSACGCSMRVPSGQSFSLS